MEILLFFSRQYDQGNAIVSIHAGQGGTEAMDWASMLFRMYLRYCEKRDWGTEIITETAGEEAGTKTVIFRVVGTWAYGYLKKEAGTHRLVRQSPFNADKLRQTSFALVEVLPEISLTEGESMEVKPEQLSVEVCKASGPGGQNVNKRMTAVKITHLPTKITVASQTERSLAQNKESALKILYAKLYQLKENQRSKELARIKGKAVAIEWGSQIRSYVLHPYQLIKDVRTDVETSDTGGVLDGKLDVFIDAEIRT